MTGAAVLGGSFVLVAVVGLVVLTPLHRADREAARPAPHRSGSRPGRTPPEHGSNGAPLRPAVEAGRSGAPGRGGRYGFTQPIVPTGKLLPDDVAVKPNVTLPSGLITRL